MDFLSDRPPAGADELNETETRNNLLQDSGLQKPAAGDVIPGRFIVTLKDDLNGSGNAVVQAKLDSMLNRLKLDPRTQPDTVIYKHALNGFSARLTQAQKQAIENDPDVEFVEQDRVVSNPKVSRHTLRASSGGELPSGIERIDGHLSKTANAPGGVDVDVAVIDTGINLNHPELNVVKDVSFVPGVKTGDDDDGHGSHVAGIIAARKDGKGIVGVAPGARLWALKVLDKDGNGSWSQIIKAIDYVTEHANEIEVANMSLGDTDKSKALNRAISKSVDKGVPYIVAAGNESHDASKSTPSDHPRVLAVSAIADGNGKGGGGSDPACEPDEKDDTFATFSNFGKMARIAAPGVCIESASKRQGNNVDTYESMSGTSMAAPHVAGAAALLKARNPQLKPDQVYDTLIKHAKSQSDPVYGFKGDPDAFPEPLLNVKDF